MKLLAHRKQSIRLIMRFVVLCSIVFSSLHYQVVAFAAQEEGSTLEVPQEARALFLPTVYATGSNTADNCRAGEAGESDNIFNAITICSGQIIAGQVSETDKDDVYRIHLVPGDRLLLKMEGNGPDADLFVYAPRTKDVDEINRDQWVKTSNSRNSNESLEITTDRSGYWYIDVYAFEGTIQYTVSVTVE